MPNVKSCASVLLFTLSRPLCLAASAAGVAGAQSFPLTGPSLVQDLNPTLASRPMTVIAPTSVGVLAAASSGAGEQWIASDPQAAFRSLGPFGIGFGSDGRPMVADLGGRVVTISTNLAGGISISPMICSTDGVTLTPLAYFSSSSFNRVFKAGNRAFIPQLGGLLVTDGTPQGTKRFPFFSTRPNDGVEYHSRLVFADSTVAVYDESLAPIEVLSASTSASWVVVVNDRILWFSQTTKNLMSSDGTAAGTLAISPALDVTSSGSRRAVVIGDKAIFSTDAATWITDGTAAGTSRILDFPLDAEAVGGFWYGIDGSTTGLNTLYRSDGTAAGTIALAQTKQSRSSPTFISANRIDARFVGFQGRVYFRGYDAATGDELWSTDGTPLGTSMVADLTPGAASTTMNAIAAVDAGVLVSTNLLGGQDQLFLADGPSSIRAIKPAGISGQTLSSYSGFIGKSGTGVVYAGSAPSGAALWTLGDRPGEAQPFSNILTPLTPGTAIAIVGAAQPLALTPGDAVVFLKTTDFGTEPWRYRAADGSLELITDLTAGTASTTPFYTCATDSGVFFTVRLASSDRLYFTDGTPAGTRLVVEHPRTGADAIYDLSPAGARCFFRSAGSGSSIRQWLSDGTPAGTAPFTSFTSGTVPNRAVVFGNRLFFEALQGSSADNLYSAALDGTGVKLQPVAGALSPPSPSGLTATDDRLFFLARFGTGTLRPFSMDLAGNASGPLASVAVSTPGFFVGHHGVLFNAASNGEPTESLWVSDGSTAGTRPVQTFDGKPLLRGFQIATVPGGVLWQAGVDGESQTLWLVDERNATAIAVPRADDPERPLAMWSAKFVYVDRQGTLRNNSRLFLTLDDAFTGREPFLIDLCPADIDNDGVSDLVDFMAFFADWEVAGPLADRDLDRTTDLEDFFLFFESFDLGCPA